MSIFTYRGGATNWYLSCEDLDVSTLQVVSIDGISINASFEPTMQSSTVTVKALDPEGIITEDSVFDVVDSILNNQRKGKVFYVRFSSQIVWGGNLSNFIKTDQQVTLTLIGKLAEYNKDYEIYDIKAKTPKDAFYDWISGAIDNTYIAKNNYNDDYYRNRAKVAPSASTLGFWPEPYSYEPPRLYGHRAELDEDDLYQEVVYDYGDLDCDPIIKVTDFTPHPSVDSNDRKSSVYPLNFHKAGRQMYFHLSVGVTDAPIYGGRTPPENCNWLVGRDQYVSVTNFNLTDNNVSDITISGAKLEPSGTQMGSVRTATIAEIVGQSIALSVTGVGWSKIPTYTKRVSQGVYGSSRLENASTIWGHWKSESVPTWTESDKIQTTFEFSDVLIGRAIASNDSSYGGSCSLKYTHPDSSDWVHHNITANCVEYTIRQNYTPVTIDQKPWKESEAMEAAWLGGLCPAENASVRRVHGTNVRSYIELVDLYPEKGSIYPVPLCTSTSSKLQWQQDNPLPQTVNCSYTDWIGQENKITTQSFGTGSSSKDLTILQGSISETDINASIGVIGELYDWGYRQYYRNSNDWEYGPGALSDRYSGVEYEDGAITVEEIPCNWQHQVDGPGGTVEEITFPENASSLYGFCFLKTDGGITPCPRSPYPSSGSSTQGFSDRSVRGKDGVEEKLFGEAYNIATMHPVMHGLDFMPAMSMLKASERVYSLPARPTYMCTVSFSFVVIDVGRVVLMHMPDFDNQPWLALVMGKTINTSSNSVSLTIAPMHPVTEADYSNWSGLQDMIEHLSFNEQWANNSQYIPTPTGA